MKHINSRTVIALLALLLALLPVSALANDGPQLLLSAESFQLKVGQEVVVTMYIERAPTIYGVESHLAFDPAILEVTALEHGDFLTPNPEQEAFILQNRFDNEAGTLDYALTLLNPAPSIEGDGLLATVTFRAKAGGPASIDVTKAALGTRDGETIPLPAESAQLTISGEGMVAGSQPVAQEEAAQESALPATEEESTLLVAEAETSEQVVSGEDSGTLASEENLSPQPRPVRVRGEEADSDSSRLLGLSVVAGAGLLVIAIGLVGLAGIIGGWFWLRRRRT